MQVFMSEYTFEDSAKVLDNKRLVKQLLEGRQILAALAGQTKGWRNHPATKMFEGYELALYGYLYCIVKEMDARGYKYENNWNEIVRLRDYFDREDGYSNPPWFVDRATLHSVVTTHRRSLYNKAPELYPQYEYEASIGADFVCCDSCNYYWPVKGHGERAIINT
jgi:Pyrimidine dimer DNA glycosylase